MLAAPTAQLTNKMFSPCPLCLCGEMFLVFLKLQVSTSEQTIKVQPGICF